ncbi:MAG: MFS transporter [Dehalococcoidia bacterium]|nr:MFS transporter [Dehalococcoidia bacterium]
MFTFLMGCGWSVWLLARLSYVTDVMPVHLRGRALSTLGGINRAGNFFGPFLGAAAAVVAGLEGAYVVHLVSAVLAAGLLLVLMRGESALPLRARTRPVHESRPRERRRLHDCRRQRHRHRGAPCLPPGVLPLWETTSVSIAAPSAWSSASPWPWKCSSSTRREHHGPLGAARPSPSPASRLWRPACSSSPFLRVRFPGRRRPAYRFRQRPRQRHRHDSRRRLLPGDRARPVPRCVARLRRPRDRRRTARRRRRHRARLPSRRHRWTMGVIGAIGAGLMLVLMPETLNRERPPAPPLARTPAKPE